MSKHSMTGRRWAAIRQQVFSRDNFRCRACGAAGRLECHHVIPLEKGGPPFALQNLKTLCVNCHIEIHRPRLSPERQAWRERLERLATP